MPPAPVAPPYPHPETFNNQDVGTVAPPKNFKGALPPIFDYQKICWCSAVGVLCVSFIQASLATYCMAARGGTKTQTSFFEIRMAARGGTQTPPQAVTFAWLLKRAQTGFNSFSARAGTSTLACRELQKSTYPSTGMNHERITIKAELHIQVFRRNVRSIGIPSVEADHVNH